MTNWSGKLIRSCPQSFLEAIFPYPSKLGVSGKDKIASHLENWDNSFNAYDSLSNLFSQDYNEYIKLDEQKNPIKDLFRSSQKSFNRTLTTNDLLFWNTNYTLQRLDKLTMAHGLEARVPFLDHRIVELFVGNRTNYNLKGFKQKQILREYLRRNTKLNAKIINQKKQAFFLPPEDSFSNRDYQIWLKDIISEQSLRELPFLNTKNILRLRDKKDISLVESKKIISFAMYIIWNQEFNKFSRGMNEKN